MLHGFSFLKLVFQHHLHIQMSVILNFFNTKDLYSGCAPHTQSNWYWRDLFQIVQSSENCKKGL